MRPYELIPLIQDPLLTTGRHFTPLSTTVNHHSTRFAPPPAPRSDKPAGQSGGRRVEERGGPARPDPSADVERTDQRGANVHEEGDQGYQVERSGAACGTLGCLEVVRIVVRARP